MYEAANTTMPLDAPVFHLDQDSDLVVAMGRPFENPICRLPARRRAIVRLIKKQARGTASLSREAKTGVVRMQVPVSNIDALRHLVEKLEVQIQEVLQEPLVPSDVEQLLGISARERIRWGKDGRLAKSGVGSIRKGDQVIYYAKHPAGAVAMLMARPEIIAEWRDRDVRER